MAGVVVVLAAVPLIWAGPAPASPRSTHARSDTTFIFRGALRGKLRIAPKNCDGAGPHGVTLDNIAGTLAGSKATTWSIQIVSPKNGTFKLTRRTLADVTVSGMKGSRTQDQWSFGAAGTLAVHGTRGDVSVELWSSADRKIHVAGSWTCPA